MDLQTKTEPYIFRGFWMRVVYINIYIYIVHIQHVQKCSIYYNNSARDTKHKNTTIKATTIKATSIQITTVQTTVKYDVCTWNVPSHNKNILS